MSGTPDWLQSNNNGEEPAAPVFSADLEAVDSGFSDETNSKRQSSSSGDADYGEKSSRPSLCSCRTISLLFVSCAFLALFIFSAVVQNNDLQGIQWIVFYSLHAALAAAFIVYWTCCFPEKVLYLLSAAMTVWSIVYIILKSIDLSKTEKGGPETANGRTEYEDIAFELAGACIGVASSLYHSFMAKCCVKTEK
mmetsp:Transcript_7551/g.18620  ORF Transcript_7551/g.18620 Transcript_7551/m.18620 type:complete len:194 (+) Transcript_7551:143-724(+)